MADKPDIYYGADPFSIIFGTAVGGIFGRPDKVVTPSDVFKRTGDWNDPNLIQDAQRQFNEIAHDPTATKRQKIAAERNAKEFGKRLERLEDRGVVPDDDFAGPDPETVPPSDIVGDQEPSPVFGAGAGAAFGIEQDRARREKIAKAIMGEKQPPKPKFDPKRFGMKETGKIVAGSAAARTMINSVLKQFGLKVKKTRGRVGRGARMPKAGGLGGLGVLGAQLGLEKLNEHLEQVQFREMERILKQQQLETNKVIRAARRTGAGGTPGAPVPVPRAAPPGAPPTKTSTARTEPPRPRPAAPLQTPNAPVIAAPKAPQGLPAASTRTTTRTTSSSGPIAGPKIGNPPPTFNLAKLLQFANLASVFTNKGAPGRAVTNTFLPSPSPSPVSNVTNFFSSTSRTAPGEQSCTCRSSEPRRKRRKKSGPPKVCVSNYKAKSLNLI